MWLLGNWVSLLFQKKIAFFACFYFLKAYAWLKHTVSNGCDWPAYAYDFTSVDQDHFFISVFFLFFLSPLTKRRRHYQSGNAIRHGNQSVNNYRIRNNNASLQDIVFFNKDIIKELRKLSVNRLIYYFEVYSTPQW